MERRTDPNHLPSAALERALRRWGDLSKAGPSSDYRRPARLLVAAEGGVHAVGLSEEPHHEPTTAAQVGEISPERVADPGAIRLDASR
jgi:hypothetical protein